jgi:hypothetical protein
MFLLPLTSPQSAAGVVISIVSLNVAAKQPGPQYSLLAILVLGSRLR